MLPILKIQRDSRINKYLVYRRDSEDKLPNNISKYKMIVADMLISNIGNSNILTVTDSKCIIEDNVIKNTSPKLLEKCKVNCSIKNENNKEPIVSISSELKKENVDIFYRIIGQNGNYITLLSEIINVKFNQDINKINQLIYIGNEVVSNSSIKDIATISLKKEYFIDKTKSLNKDLVSFNLKYLKTDGAISLQIKNIWNYIDFKNKRLKDIRVYTTYKSKRTAENDKVDSEILSDVLKLNFNIPLDALIILRKEDDGTDMEISITDNSAVKKQILRYNGKFEPNPKNINEYEFIGDGICEKNNYLISENSNLNEFHLCDKGIVENKVYKYTIYCIDNLLDISDGYTFKVQT